MTRNILIFTSIILIVTGVLNFSPVLGISNSANAFITLTGGVLFVLAHGSMALGWRNIIAFLLITIVVSFTLEALGVATGWVFGSYYYTDNLGPKILGVPPMIQAGYTAMGYASLMTARVILGMKQAPIKLGSILALCILGTFIMVSWDVAMDPYQSTSSGDWIWTQGGPYFGIGLHNYVGWFVTVFLFMFIYHLYARKYPEKVLTEVKNNKYFWSQPTLYYGLMAMGIIIVPWVGGVSLPYATPQNYNQPLMIFEYSLALIAFFVMGTPVVAALAKLFISESSKN